MPASEDVFISPPADASAPAQQSSEQMLEQLALAVTARRRHRNRLKFWYGVEHVCYFAAIGYSLVAMFRDRLSNPMSIVGISVVSLFLTMPLFYWSNKAFYRRQGRARDLAIMELARRGEERALGPLLELMDIRITGSPRGWAQSRSVFISAMTLLVSKLTPAEFSDLTDAQIHQLTPLILTREPGLTEAITEMFVRCGDARALRALHKYETAYKMQRVQKYNPFLMVMLAWLKKSGMVMVNQELSALALRCREAIQPRVEAENRMAQLLRASGRENAAGEIHAAQLLRGAMPTNAATRPDQLLRPDNAENLAVSVKSTEAEAETSLTVTAGNGLEGGISG